MPSELHEQAAQDRRFSGIGPRGGNANNPELKPAFRRAPLHVNVVEGEEDILTLHQFHDTSTHGKKDEKPWMRMAALLMVQGMTHEKIAEVAGVAPNTVSQLNSQLWFQQLKARLTADATRDISERFKAEANRSLDTLISIREGCENDRVVADVCKFMLEQANGKAVQKVVSENTHRAYATPDEEMTALQAEIAALRKATPLPS